MSCCVNPNHELLPRRRNMRRRATKDRRGHHPRWSAGGGGGGSWTRVRKYACERYYRFSPAWIFAVAVKARQNRQPLVRLISPFVHGPRTRASPHWWRSVQTPWARARQNGLP